MNNYYIKILALQNCMYSLNSIKLLNDNKIPHKIVDIDNNNKELYKNNLISTYPQIFLKKKNTKGNLLLGGFNDLNLFLNKFKNNKLNKDDIEEFCNKYNWSRKATLRLIQLVNNFK